MTHVERQGPHISGKGSLINRGTSSLFDIPTKLDPAGQSYISLAVAPSTEIEFDGQARPKKEYENTYQMEPSQRYCRALYIYLKSMNILRIYTLDT